MKNALMYMAATESELNSLVEGRQEGHPTSWPAGRSGQRLRPNHVGVLWRDPEFADEPVRPLALVTSPDDNRRLFGRFAQLRADFSPLSAWCHVLPSDRFDSLDDAVRTATLNGLEAAWTGLAIAEAALLSGRRPSKLRIAACLSTQTYAIARTSALWGHTPVSEILDRYDAAHSLVRSAERVTPGLRAALAPIWATLLAVTDYRDLAAPELRHLASALNSISPSHDEDLRSQTLHSVFADIPQAEFLLNLARMTPERRVKQFDGLVSAISEAPPSHRASLAFLAGYLATVAAGGAPSLGLAEDISTDWPEVTAWAYVIGSMGERITWTSSFDGLGRLVAREMMRPFRLDDAPTCDFALDEAVVLIDRQLGDPLVYLKVKQLRVVTVALYPGVNVAFPITEPAEPKRSTPTQRRQPEAAVGGSGDFWSTMAEGVWPYIQAKLRADERASPKRYPRKGRKSDPQGGLPLDE